MDTNTGKYKILLIMNEVENLGLVLENLKEDFQVFTSNKGIGTLEIIRKIEPQLIIIDYNLSDISGLELCKKIKSNMLSSEMPIFILSAERSKDVEANCLTSGALDYLPKPIHYNVLKARIQNVLEINIQERFLKDLVQIRTFELEKVQNNMINTLAIIAEYRDPETNGHIMRIKNYLVALAQKLKDHPKFKTTFTPNMIKVLSDVSPLHDVGKIIIPDNILLKPGRLTPEEYKIMQKHTSYGAHIIDLIEKGIEDNFYLEQARDIVLYHHEKWDGTGYPKGLKGDEIPIVARIMAIADVYDALVTKRVYKEPITHELALKEIEAQKGKAFDPDVVEAFLALESIISKIAEKYADK